MNFSVIMDFGVRPPRRLDALKSMITARSGRA